MAWKLIYGKLPVEEALQRRGCALASPCSLCQCHGENVSHLFFECTFATTLWAWLAEVCNHNQPRDVMQSLDMATSNWSAQISDVLVAAVISVLNVIWDSRNRAIFYNVWP